MDITKFEQNLIFSKSWIWQLPASSQYLSIFKQIKRKFYSFHRYVKFSISKMQLMFHFVWLGHIFTVQPALFLYSILPLCLTDCGVTWRTTWRTRMWKWPQTSSGLWSSSSETRPRRGRRKDCSGKPRSVSPWKSAERHRLFLQSLSSLSVFWRFGEMPNIKGFASNIIFGSLPVSSNTFRVIRDNIFWGLNDYTAFYLVDISV